MTRVLYVGQQPDTVDFSDPSLPPGMNAAKIRAGIELGMQQMTERGWEAKECMIPPDAQGIESLRTQLAAARYDCVVIGGGLRLVPKSTALFETVVNTIHETAPQARFAFNTRPEDTADAVARSLGID